MIVVVWFQLIHPGLPLLVKQKYGSELLDTTLALGSILDQLHYIEDTKAMRIGSTTRRNPSSGQGQHRPLLALHPLQNCQTSTYHSQSNGLSLPS